MRIPRCPSLLSATDLNVILHQSSSPGCPKVIPLDVSLLFPPASEYAQYLDQRIPGAKFFSLKRYAGSHPRNLTIMLPSPETFVAAMRYLGVERTDHIVCYDCHGMWTSARGAWMLMVYDHPNVSILDGGLPAWKSKGYDIASGPIVEEHTSTYPMIEPNRAMIADFKTLQNPTSSKHIVIDVRPSGEYDKLGHVPGSVSIPFTDLLTATRPLEEIEAIQHEGPAKFLSLDARRDILIRKLGEDVLKDLIDGRGSEVIIMCGWGVTACLLWSTFAEIGVHTTVSDESWEGWEMQPGLPIEHQDGSLTYTEGKTSFPELQVPIAELPDDGTPAVTLI